MLRLRYGDVSFLLMGDVHQDAELSMIGRNLDMGSTVLKVAHHGSASSTSQAFLDYVRPQLAMVSVGQGNRFGPPRLQVRERLQNAVGQEMLLLTSEQGTVEVTTDGDRLWVATQR